MYFLAIFLSFFLFFMIEHRPYLWLFRTHCYKRQERSRETLVRNEKIERRRRWCAILIDNKRNNMREKRSHNNFFFLCKSYALAGVSTVEIADILSLINEYIKMYDYLKFSFFLIETLQFRWEVQQDYSCSRYDRYKN